MYIIKELSEDFLVEEVSNLLLTNDGPYSVFTLRKKDLTTHAAVDLVAKELGISGKDVTYAGLKDKKAITTQYLSIRRRKKLEESYEFFEVSLNFVGYTSEKIHPGALRGNKFCITIRNASTKPASLKRMINYFGEQRFSRHNHLIGKALVKKEYESARQLIIDSDARASQLEKETFFQRYDKRLLRIYVQAYQSHLWNKSVDCWLQESEDNISMPVIGFGMQYDDRAHKIIKQVLKEENITERDFINRSFSEISQEGGKRPVFAEVKDLSVSEVSEDELHLGMKKYVVKFFLDKGSYATECIKQMMK